MSTKDPFVKVAASGTEAAAGLALPDTDASDMARLGKAQQFRRNFSFWSTFGFVSIYST